MKPEKDSNNTAGAVAPAATCSVIDSPEAELRYLKQVAKANGFDSITDAIAKAKRYKHALNLIANTNSSAIRPSRVEQGVLLAARWLIEYGEPSVAAYMLRDHGLDGCDLRKMEEQDIEILATLNATEGTHFILPNTEASRGA